jgi:hypothetical protein
VRAALRTFRMAVKRRRPGPPRRSGPPKALAGARRFADSVGQLGGAGTPFPQGEPHSRF